MQKLTTHETDEGKEITYYHEGREIDADGVTYSVSVYVSETCCGKRWVDVHLFDRRGYFLAAHSFGGQDGDADLEAAVTEAERRFVHQLRAAHAAYNLGESPYCRVASDWLEFMFMTNGGE